jgi:hypothetical protein
MMLDRLQDALVPEGLCVMGAAHPDDVGTVVLIGMDAGAWHRFVAAPEYSDDRRDPLDRWSKRLLTAVAAAEGAQAIFPSDGPPYPPFISWALATGRFWQSPVGMLVHDRAGLMISMRGALMFDDVLDLPPPNAANPCDSCAAQPCRSACPVDALGGAAGYDVAACKGFLATAAGAFCMTRGCAARRACPVSAAFGRAEAQSAFHMRAFLPA